MVGEILKVIRDLAEQKMTMVVVTHEMEFAREISHRVVFLQEGRVAVEGTPQQVFELSDHPALREFLKR